MPKGFLVKRSGHRPPTTGSDETGGEYHHDGVAPPSLHWENPATAAAEDLSNRYRMLSPSTTMTSLSAEYESSDSGLSNSPASDSGVDFVLRRPKAEPEESGVHAASKKSAMSPTMALGGGDVIAARQAALFSIYEQIVLRRAAAMSAVVQAASTMQDKTYNRSPNNAMTSSFPTAGMPSYFLPSSYGAIHQSAASFGLATVPEIGRAHV